MNEAHLTFSIDGKLFSKWAKEWSDIKAEHPQAILIMTSN